MTWEVGISNYFLDFQKNFIECVAVYLPINKPLSPIKAVVTQSFLSYFLTFLYVRFFFYAPIPLGIELLALPVVTGAGAPVWLPGIAPALAGPCGLNLGGGNSSLLPSQVYITHFRETAPGLLKINNNTPIYFPQSIPKTRKRFII